MKYKIGDYVYFKSYEMPGIVVRMRYYQYQRRFYYTIYDKILDKEWIGILAKDLDLLSEDEYIAKLIMRKLTENIC